MTDNCGVADIEPGQGSDEICCETVYVVAVQRVVRETVTPLVHAQDAKPAAGEHAYLAVPKLVVQAKTRNQYYRRPIAEILHVYPHAVIRVDEWHFWYHLRSCRFTADL
ncbi:hypothetical protein IWGMT90018_47460 [Mycobacterium kiyosense]|nr:hypothetical protein IWGMT90018_47460 [Mycobacterium kiyosense]